MNDRNFQKYLAEKMGEQEAPVSGFPVQTQKLLLKVRTREMVHLNWKYGGPILDGKIHYMSEYLHALYSTFAFFKTTEMSPLMKHNNTMKQRDEWWKMKQNEYGNSFSDKNFVHQMIVDLLQTVVRHAFLKCPEKN